MIAVSNAGPLIACAKIGRFALLRDLFGQIKIPPAVYEEIVIKGTGRTGSDEVQHALGVWLDVVQLQTPAQTHSLRAQLGAGESEAIVLAAELNADYLLLDDRKARAVATFMGLPVVGTAGMLREARRANLLADLAGALDDLRANGYHISEEVYRRALRESD